MIHFFAGSTVSNKQTAWNVSVWTQFAHHITNCMTEHISMTNSRKMRKSKTISSLDVSSPMFTESSFTVTDEQVTVQWSQNASKECETNIDDMKIQQRMQKQKHLLTMLIYHKVSKQWEN